MKKIFILGTTFFLLASTSANAEVSVGINIGPPVVEEPVYPAPAYVTPAPDWPSYHYDRHRHWHHDYWARRRHEHELREQHYR